jgi:hypothetical protein
MWFNTAKTGDTKPPKKMTNRVTNDVIDIVESVFSLKLKMSVWLLTVFGTFTVGSFVSFVTDWVFDPAESFVALIAVIIMDSISGMYRAYINNAFETKKAVRVFWTLISHSALLSASYNMAKGSNVFLYVTSGLFTMLCSVNMLSFVKNLSLLGLVPRSIASWLYKKIDVYKNEMDKQDHSNPDRDSDK